MGPLILVLLIGVPLVEIAVFIEVGGIIGLWPTIAIVVATALLGAAMLRRQGLATLLRARAELEAQRLPVRELFDGLCLLLGGALLLTPGFVTDAVGFALLIPPLRAVLGRRLWQALLARGQVDVNAGGGLGGMRPPNQPPHDQPRNQPPDGPTIIDGDYHEVAPESGAKPTDETGGHDDDRGPSR